MPAIDMRLWTIQPFTVWEQLQQKDQLRVDEALLPYHGYVPEAYRWLMRQLAQRFPGYRGRCHGGPTVRNQTCGSFGIPVPPAVRRCGWNWSRGLGTP